VFALRLQVSAGRGVGVDLDARVFDVCPALAVVAVIVSRDQGVPPKIAGAFVVETSPCAVGKNPRAGSWPVSVVGARREAVFKVIVECEVCVRRTNRTTCVWIAVGRRCVAQRDARRLCTLSPAVMS